jgi:hypothetical protein
MLQMPSRGKKTRTIRLNYLARVEGEAALHLTMRDGRVSDLRLEIFEPPRFFEAFLRGREVREVPDIVARICGICPVAYQMSARESIREARQQSTEIISLGFLKQHRAELRGTRRINQSNMRSGAAGYPRRLRIYGSFRRGRTP